MTVEAPRPLRASAPSMSLPPHGVVRASPDSQAGAGDSASWWEEQDPDKTDGKMAALALHILRLFFPQLPFFFFFFLIVAKHR